MTLINKMLLLAFSLVSFVAQAQHIGLRMTNKGIQNLLTSALNSYGESNKQLNRLIVPEDVYYDRIKKDVFDSNPVIASIQQIIDLQQNEDFIFYFKWSPIYLDAQITPGSLKVQTTGEERSFSAAIKFSLNSLKISGRYLELCELKNWKCDKKNALYGKFINYAIKLKKGSQVDLAAILDVKVQNGKVEIKLKHFLTNLVKPKNSTELTLFRQFGVSATHLAEFDITFEDLLIPPPSVTINGETIELDVSKLKDAILSAKNYLSSQLVNFAGNFMSKDLTNILNKDFFGKLDDLKTTLRLVDYDSRNNFNDSLQNLYNAPTFDRSRFHSSVDNTYVAPRYNVHFNSRINIPEPTFMEQLLMTLKSIVYQIDYDLVYKKTTTYNDKDVVIDFSSQLKLNDKAWTLGTSLRNGKSKLKSPNFIGIDSKSHDVAIALSEPMINAALKVAKEKGLIKALVRDLLKMPGVYITGINLHFEEGKKTTSASKVTKSVDKTYNNTIKADNTRIVTPYTNFKPFQEYNDHKKVYRTVQYRTQDSIVAVVNVKVKLKELPTTGIGSWIENRIGAMLEGGVIWFPLEVKFYPQIVQENGKTLIELYADQPFSYNGLKNTYGYPYKDMYSIVEDGVLDELKQTLKPLLSELPNVDITSYLSYPGLKLRPLKVYVKNTGHLVITSNIIELDLKELSTLGSE